MLDNSFIFSLVISLINTISLYLFSNRESNVVVNKDEKRNELLLTFFVTFASCFLIKSISNKNVPVKQFTDGSLLSQSTRPPF